jgi:hypothetical protein
LERVGWGRLLRLQLVTLALTAAAAAFGTAALALAPLLPAAAGTWPISPAMKTAISSSGAVAATILWTIGTLGFS